MTGLRCSCRVVVAGRDDHVTRCKIAARGIYLLGTIVVRVIDFIDSRVCISSSIIGSEKNALIAYIKLGRDIITSSRQLYIWRILFSILSTFPLLYRGSYTGTKSEGIAFNNTKSMPASKPAYSNCDKRSGRWDQSEHCSFFSSAYVTLPSPSPALARYRAQVDLRPGMVVFVSLVPWAA